MRKNAADFMKSLKEIIDGFEGTLEEDSLEGTREFHDYLSQQHDYSVSEDDLLYLLDVKKSIRNDPDPKKIRNSSFFWTVVYDYVIKGIDDDRRMEFSNEFIKLYTGDLSYDEEKLLFKRISEKGVPNFSKAKERVDILQAMLSECVTAPDAGSMGEVAHYVNNSLTSINGNFQYLESIAGKQEEQ